MVYCNGYYNDSYHCNTAWYNWGRWVLAAAVVVFFIAIFLMLACARNRRRRQHGAAPMYGTGWMGNHNGYGPNQPYNNGPAPPYQPAPVGFQQNGNAYNGNDGYYAPYGQQVELQQPPNVYARGAGDPVYDAPPGPPPTKGDGVIR